MHMSLTRRAVERAAHRVARMLAGKKPSALPTPPCAPVALRPLVSWCSETHSRRADEEARRMMSCAID